MPDIVGIGAINLDFIVDSIKAQQMNPKEREHRLAAFEWGVERRATEEDVQYALRQLADLDPQISPGGAALNVVAAAASTSAAVTVGFVGVCGRSPDPRFDFANWFSVLGIDSAFIRSSNEKTGTCVSYTQGSERSMLTCNGANSLLEDHIADKYDAILAYLAQSQIVHVTATANQRGAKNLSELLSDLKSRSPAVMISCDPGALWAPLDRPSSINAILQVSDILFANSREFDLLGHRTPNMTDLDTATYCFHSFLGLKAVLVLKKYDQIKIFYRLGNDVIERVFRNSIILNDLEVIDDTGAGDVFAGGMLTGLRIPVFETSDSVELGLRMARRKLRFIGMTGISDFRRDFLDVTAEIAASGSTVGPAESYEKRVFIGHGHDAVWRHVKDCLSSWGLKPTYFESQPPTGKFVSEVLTEQALGADFAVIVVTGDDSDSSGKVRGRQNVVHEIGLMQGRLGWSRVAILLEEGVDPFSNIAGLQYITFSKGKVYQAFHELENTLVREGLISPPASS